MRRAGGRGLSISFVFLPPRCEEETVYTAEAGEGNKQRDDPCHNSVDFGAESLE